jgi:hypothetical protein
MEATRPRAPALHSADWSTTTRTSSVVTVEGKGRLSISRGVWKLATVTQPAASTKERYSAAVVSGACAMEAAAAPQST